MDQKQAVCLVGALLFLAKSFNLGNFFYLTGINSKIKYVGVCFFVIKIAVHLFTHTESVPACTDPGAKVIPKPN